LPVRGRALNPVIGDSSAGPPALLRMALSAKARAIQYFGAGWVRQSKEPSCPVPLMFAL
jgi:hypothetical protein